IAVRYGLAVRDERELAAKCGAMTAGWRSRLQSHRNEFEMTLKVPAAAAPPARPDRRDFTTGAGYLRALHESANAADIDSSFRADVERRLVPVTTEHRWLRE